MSKEDHKIARDEALKLFEEQPNELVLQELRDAYQRQWDLKDSHERKATSIIAISSIIISLLFGFAAFLLDSDNKINHFEYVIALIAASIVLNLLAVLMSIISVRMKDYKFILTDIKIELIIELLKKKKIEVILRLIKEYNESIIHNAVQNTSKLNWIKGANWFLFAGIAIIPLPLFVSQIQIS